MHMHFKQHNFPLELNVQFCWVLSEMQKEDPKAWMERDLVGVLTAFFNNCDASHCKNKKVRGLRELVDEQLCMYPFNC